MLKDYNIEIAKIKSGHSEVNFNIDRNFFSLKANSLISDGNISVLLNIFKKEGLFSFKFSVKGTISTQCDICLDDIEMLIEGEETIFYKITETPKQSDDEFVYIDDSIFKINVYDNIYEIICTTVPMVKSCEKNSLTPKSCNPQMLKYISNNNDDNDEKKITTNSIKDNLNR
ncbi:MAG: DUF177 domain-containing protein [Bacteroidia bacterium]|nr:DUF177 domain-containing protein [Bacteroidia bacterium]